MGKTAISMILFILNIIYVTLGVVLAYASVMYYIDMQLIKQIRTSDLYVIGSGLKWPDLVPIVFFTVGVLVTLVSLCGFGGCYSKTVLLVYIVFLVTTIGVSTAAASIVYNYADNNNTDEFIGKIIENGIEEVRGTDIELGNTTAFGILEERYRCCGDKDAKFYLGLTRGELYPKSCCVSDQPCSGRMGNAKIAQRRHGCRKVVVHKTRNFIYYLWVGCAGVSVAGLLNLVVAVVVYVVKVRKHKKDSHVLVQDTQMVRINGASVNSSV